MNTQETIRNIQILGGGLALLSVAGLAIGISKGIKHRRKYRRDYDPDTVEELKGRILDIATNRDKHDETRGVILILETENDEIIPVHLGPEWYLSHQQNELKDGDKITVTGSKVSYQNNPVIVAAQVQRGNRNLVLRDETGHPRWRSWVKQK